MSRKLSAFATKNQSNTQCASWFFLILKILQFVAKCDSELIYVIIPVVFRLVIISQDF